MYLKESTALHIVCRNKLEKLKLVKYSDTTTFFSEFEKSVNELKSAGTKISEKQILNYMLNTLPNQYSYIGDLIDTLRGQAWVKMMKKSNFFYCIISLKISLKICSRNPFIKIRFRFLLGIKNVKRKKSNFRENFTVISKSCRTLCSAENNH